MRRNKLLKAALWSAAVLVLAAVAATVGLKLYFTPERLRALALDYASRHLGREVSFDTVSAGLAGFSLKGLRISESPDFSKGEFASAAELSLRPSFAELLRRNLLVESVSVSGLRLKVTETAPGVYNFSDLMGEPAAVPGAPPAGEAPSAPPPLAVSSLRVRDSAFSYRNAAGDLSVDLTGINLAASRLSPSELFPFEADLAVAFATPEFKGSMPARVKGSVALGGFDPEKGRAEIREAQVSFSGVDASLKGSLSNLMEPDAKLTVELRPFSLAALKDFIEDPPDLEVPAVAADADLKLTFTGLQLRSLAFRAGALAGTMKGRAAWEPRVSYSFSGEVSADLPAAGSKELAGLLKGFEVPPSLSLPAAKVSASYSLAPGLFDVKKFSLETAALSASGKTSVDFGGKELKAAGSARAEIRDLGKAAAMAPSMTAEYKLSGSASASADFTWSDKPSVSGKASLKGVGASALGYALAGLSGDIDLSSDRVASRKLAGRLDGHDFTASFEVRDFQKHPKAGFDLKLARLKLPDLPPAAASPAKKAEPAPGAAAEKTFYADVSGGVEIGAIEHPNFSCGRSVMKLRLTNVSADLGAMGGAASFSAGPGKFSELIALTRRYPAAKVALTPMLVLQKTSKLAPALRLPDFNNVDFESIEGDYSFDKGMMRLNKSALVSSVADVSSGGTVDLPSGRLDMKINTTLKRGSGVSMSAPVGMFVTGTMDDPKVKPDIKSVVEQPAVQKVLERAAPAAEKLLKGLFKK